MNLLDRTEPWVVGLVFLVVLVAGAQLAHGLGRRLADRADEVLRSQVSTMQAALLGLLGLMLAFSFALASSRFDTRRELVVEESNAIGTSWLRAALLPEPQRTEVRELLRRYVDLRIELQSERIDRERLGEAVARAKALQDQFWNRTVEVAREQPRSVTLGLLLDSLNQTIDLQEKRIIAFHARVPPLILLLLLLVSIAAVGAESLGFGLAGRPHLLATAVLSLLIAAIITVVVDLDGPQSGWIRVSQESMVSLAHDIAAP